MKYTKFLFFPLVLVLLGFGCAQEYGTKETSQPPVETSSKSEVNDPGFDTEALETTINRDPYGKAEKAFNDLDVEPSGVLNPNQSEFSMADRLSWYQTLNWPKECEADFRFSYDPETGDLAFYPITNNQYLLRVTCSISAYQESMIFMRVYDNNGTYSGKVVDLKTYDSIKKQLTNFDNENTHQVLGFEKFDDTKKTLKLYTKARGIGDCGSHHDYQITTTDITLTKMTGQDCEVADAWHLEHPDDINMPSWPVIYEKK